MGRRVIFACINAVVVILMVLSLSGCGDAILRDIIRSIVMGPEFVVKQSGIIFQDGDIFDFLTVNSQKDETFVIENTGEANLRLTGTPKVDITGTDASDFTVVTQPDSVIFPEATAEFIIRFSAAALGQGQRTALVNIPNNDSDEASFSFSVTEYDNC